MSDDIETIVGAICASPGYRAVSPALVRNIALAECRPRRSQKETLKAVKGKLHQVATGFLGGKFDPEGLLATLKDSGSDPTALWHCCRAIMACHASTRERLPALEIFYSTIFARLGPIHSVLDFGCGLNPLAIPWMPLSADCTYTACDVHSVLVRFVGKALPLLGVTGQAQVADLTTTVIDQPADLALLLKLLPTLDQLDRSAGARLLASLKVKHMVISYPVRSLGGRAKGMPASYEARFRQLVAGYPWQVERLEFDTELVFLVTVS